MNVVVNGLMTNYHKSGKGKAILCLPGWGDSGKSFSGLAQRLQKKYTVLTIDLPGFGGTQTPAEAWSLNDYADFLAAWLKKIEATDLHAVIGYSYGGATAITALSSGKIKAKKLILIASAGVRNKHSIQKKLIRGAAKTGKLAFYLMPAKTRRRAREKLYKALGSDMLLLPHMESTFKRIINQDVTAMASKLTIPTLLIYGSKDRDTPIEDGQRLANAIKNSRLEALNGGHYLHQEQLEVVSQLVEEFINV